MLKNIRTYGRVRGRTTSSWPFDYNNTPSWFIKNNIAQIILNEKYDIKILEVGFGMGDSLYSMAENNKDFLFLGMEIYEPGLLKISKKICENHLDNLYIIQGDALEQLNKIPENSIDRIHVFFPDPWPKKRHEKRRLYNGIFFELCDRVLKPYGKIHLATDINGYANEWEKIASQRWDKNENADISIREITKYQRRGERLGHEIIDIIFIKK